MADKTTIVLAPVLAATQVGRISKGLRKELFEIKTEVSSLPKGRLSIRYRNNHIQLITELTEQSGALPVFKK